MSNTDRYVVWTQADPGVGTTLYLISAVSLSAAIEATGQTDGVRIDAEQEENLVNGPMKEAVQEWVFPDEG